MRNLAYIRTVIIVSALIAPVFLWITRLEDYPSQSYSAIFANVFFYYWMHIAIQATFALDWLDGKLRHGSFRWFALLPVVFGVGVVVWDMHEFPVKHNIATALLMASAVFNLIYYAHNKFERSVAILLAVVGAIMFPIGMFTEVSLFWTEVIAEAAIAIGILRRIYGHDYR